MSPYRGVIFDLDGTLLDTLDGIAAAGNAALASQGYPTHPVSAYASLAGAGVDILIRRILPDSERNDETIRRMVPLQKAEYARIWKGYNKPYPEVPGMLRELASRRVAMAVLSNKADEFVRVAVSDAFPDLAFDVVQGERAGLPRKPDPASALAVADRLKLRPAELLFVGDTGLDMETAVRAGMFPVGASWGFRPGELREHGARAVIDRPEELVKLVACGI